MVSNISLALMVISLLVIFLFPVGLAIYFYKKEKYSLKAILIGALVFIVFQFLTRIPLLAYLSTQEWFKTLSATSLLFSAVLIGGLSAGIFEEVGRFIGFRYLLKKELSWKNGIAFGIGHGGIEAIGLVGLTYVNNIVISVLINTGVFDATIAQQIGIETAEMIKAQLTGTPSYMFLLAGIERVLTIIIHIALSLTVLYGILIKKPIYLLLAIILHTVLNAVAVIILRMGWGIWYAQAFILVFAAICMLGIFKSRRYFTNQYSSEI